MSIKNIPFSSGGFFHVYNRGNNRERIFFKRENYRYFLVKFAEHLCSVLDVYAFCLLANHFHFLVRIKENLAGFENLQGLGDRCPISQKFSNFFNAYSKAINKQENRVGSLFQRNFKHILIDNEAYLYQIIYYIHSNPVHHDILKTFVDYPWSSYKKVISDRTSMLRKNEVLELFGGKEAYVEFHMREPSDLSNIEKYLID